MPTWTNILNEVVHIAVGFGLSTFILAPLVTFLRRELKRIADSVDPEKPGGITEQLDQLSKKTQT